MHVTVGLQATISINVEFNSELMAHNGTINDVNPIKEGFDRGNGAVTLIA